MHRARSQARMPASAFAKGALGAVVLFVGCTTLMHVVQPELSPVDDAISYYMNGRLGWVQGAGLVALGIGSLSLALALRLAANEGRSRVGLALLAAWGAGAIVGGIFPPDPPGNWDAAPSLSGLLHGGAAMVAFLAFPVGAHLLSRPTATVARQPGSARMLRLLAASSAVGLAVFFFCLWPAFMNRAPFALGLVERMLLALYLAWIVAAAQAIRRLPGTAGSREVSEGDSRRTPRAGPMHPPAA